MGGNKMMLEMVFLYFTISNGVSSAAIHLPFSLLIGTKLKMIIFLDTYNVHHGSLQPASLAAFLIAFSAFKDFLLSCIWINVKI
jgi:hypothetical protein